MVYGLRASRGAGLADDELDAVFAALAHQARRAVLREIARRDEPLAMNELAASLDVSPQLLNKHLTTLERARLICRERRGRETHATPNPEVLDATKQWIVEMTKYWNAQLDSLEEYIASLGTDGPEADRPDTNSRERD